MWAPLNIKAKEYFGSYAMMRVGNCRWFLASCLPCVVVLPEFVPWLTLRNEAAPPLGAMQFEVSAMSFSILVLVLLAAIGLFALLGRCAKAFACKRLRAGGESAPGGDRSPELVGGASVRRGDRSPELVGAASVSRGCYHCGEFTDGRCPLCPSAVCGACREAHDVTHVVLPSLAYPSSSDPMLARAGLQYRQSKMEKVLDHMDTLVLTKGKNSGKTLRWVYDNDLEYIKWCRARSGLGLPYNAIVVYADLRDLR